MKFIQHPIAIYAAKLLVYAALSAGVFILMNKYWQKSSLPVTIQTDSTALDNIKLNLSINDSNLQTIKSNVDSILLQAQSNEAAIQRIRNSRASANSSISSMSSVELTGSLSNRYRDSL